MADKSTGFSGFTTLLSGEDLLLPMPGRDSALSGADKEQTSGISGVVSGPLSTASEPFTGDDWKASSGGSKQPPKRRISKGVIFLLLIGGALVWAAIKSSPPSRISAASNTLSTSQASITTTSRADNLIEEMPPPGVSLRLTRNQILYCLAESTRMDAWQSNIDRSSQSQISAFNRYVSDFNARCAQYKYLPNDFDVAKERANSERIRLWEAGVERTRNL